MLRRLRNHWVAWLIDRHPQQFLRWKKIELHRIGEDRDFLRLHARLVRNFAAASTRLEERYNLWSLAQSMATRPGALAEVGVFRGGTAMILCESKGDAPLHLFDTFSGMPATNPATDGAFRAGEFSENSVEHVRAFLGDYPNVQLHPGIFPQSAAALTDPHLTFKFVHLDVDLFSSTRDALAWFYPRMERGGLIVSHDYNNVTVPGVKRAFDEFFGDKPERVIPLWFSQVLVIKT